MAKTTKVSVTKPKRCWLVITFSEPYPVMQYGVQAGTPKRGEDSDFTHHPPGYQIWVPDDTCNKKWHDLIDTFLPSLGYDFDVTRRWA